MPHVKSRTDALVAIATGALGLFLVIRAWEFGHLRMAMVAGPQIFPIGIGSALVALAVLLLVRSFVHEPRDTAETFDARGVRSLLVLLASIVGFGVLLPFAGVVLAGGVLFSGVALAFESRNFLRESLIGLLISLGAYLLFTQVLGIHLPGGPFDLFVAAH